MLWRGREDSRAFVLTLKCEEAVSAGELSGPPYTCLSLQASRERCCFALRPSCARLGSLLSRCSSRLLLGRWQSVHRKACKTCGGVGSLFMGLPKICVSRSGVQPCNFPAQRMLHFCVEVTEHPHHFHCISRDTCRYLCLPPLCSGGLSHHGARALPVVAQPGTGQDPGWLLSPEEDRGCILGQELGHSTVPLLTAMNGHRVLFVGF